MFFINKLKGGSPPLVLKRGNKGVFLVTCFFSCPLYSGSIRSYCLLMSRYRILKNTQVCMIFTATYRARLVREIGD